MRSTALIRDIRILAGLTLFLTLVSWGLAAATLASVDGLSMWQPQPGGVRYLFPRVRGIASPVLAARYLEAVKRSRVYGQMQFAQKLDLSTDPSTFHRLPESSHEHPNVAVVLNRPSQMTTGNAYLPKVVQSFEAEGPRLLAIPIGLETILSENDMAQFMARLNSFDGELAVGGDDVHPHLYGLQDTSQTKGDISVERDKWQMRYMREYLRHGKGRVFWICGSMQRGAIDDGHGFHPDIAHLTRGAHQGEEQPVLVEVMAEPDSEVAKAAGAVRFLSSNFHHGSIDPGTRSFDKTPSSRITAYNIEPDGSQGVIVKAIELPGNAGFATQFHPEFRGSPEESRMIRYIAMGWKLRRRAAPEEILRCFEHGLGSSSTPAVSASNGTPW